MTQIGFYLEYDPAFYVWRFRIGQSFTDFRGVRSLPLRSDWKALLEQHGFRIERRTDTRTFAVVSYR